MVDAAPPSEGAPLLGGRTIDADALFAQAIPIRGSATAAIDLARRIGSQLPRPGSGRTLDLWRALAALSAADLTAGRVVEAHTDALSILDQAGLPIPADRTWGVFAAEASGVRLDATVAAGGFRLTGTKPWCSLAGHLDSALVTAHTDGGHRRLFSLDLRDAGVTVQRDSWFAAGLREVESGPVHFDDVAAEPVGADEWYLDRPGFSWGGAGVAACWYGGAVGVARALLSSARRREPDQIAQSHIGAVDIALGSARRALEAAAQAIDSGHLDREKSSVLAERVRTTVADAAEAVLTRVGHALGPAPLAFDEIHARRVADLTIYLRQHHAERDEAALGRAVVAADAEGEPPW
ncbi:acyl-CoA dehydrogenase family protein [Amnibacterium flavum]|uniref:Acyl-CoA dehydrogenase n=1 Tax=Amnibacterium flavum TaxID=2173173 RepID=A0A2V1HTT3_9MICO|nr:acyl-CoA dehydrogenase [Amnibacterium flavum]PVZ96016.1 acyl-CoA dehydrogenase [Amnibacterium flavum]